MTEDKISIVIPVLNDVDALKTLLPGLQEFRQHGHQVLLVDGGSSDGSLSYASTLVDRILMTGTGRGRQMNLGAENANHAILLFLHADSILSNQGIDDVIEALSEPENHWGRFNVQLDQTGFVYTLIARMMNLRSKLSGVATGDQGIFVRRETFHRVGGYKPIPLMEDIALSKSLRKHSRPVCLESILITSGRRWQQNGIFKTILLMWTLRLAYFVGFNAESLATIYYPSESDQADRDIH